MKNKLISRGGWVLGITASLLGGAGCAQEQSETVESTASALGSTKPVTQIRSGTNGWTDLTNMASDGNYVLTANLDATGKTWTPKLFTGTFDGNSCAIANTMGCGSKTISNLTINVTGSGNAGFFSTLRNAIVRNVRFINLKVTGHSNVGGLAGIGQESDVEQVGVEATITATNAAYAGGIFGQMLGGTLNRSYAKGAVNNATYSSGGLAGAALVGPTGSGTQSVITQCYAAVTVAPDTSSGNIVFAGGLAGNADGTKIYEVYADGNVTGRTFAGGLLGNWQCEESLFPSNNFLYHGIYRGDVKDVGLTNGWSGVLGSGQGQDTCYDRFDQLFWDTTRDPTPNTPDRHFVFAFTDPTTPVQKGASSADLRAPTTVNSGVYAIHDNTFTTQYWDAGTSTEHHALVGMPGGLAIQPR